MSETRSLHHIEPINQTNGANYTDTLNQPEKIKMDPVNDDMDNDENHTFPDHLQIVEEVGKCFLYMGCNKLYSFLVQPTLIFYDKNESIDYS